MQVTVGDNDVGEGDFNKEKIEVFLSTFYPQVRNQQERDRVFNKIMSSVELKIFVEVMSTAMNMTFKRLSQVEQTLKQTEKDEAQIETERNVQFLMDIFNIDKSREMETNSFRKLRENFKDYFSNIDDPVDFLNSLREKS